MALGGDGSRRRRLRSGESPRQEEGPDQAGCDNAGGRQTARVRGDPESKLLRTKIQKYQYKSFVTTV